MKITTEQFEYMKSKPAFQNEGIVGAIFNRLLKKKLKNNTDFKKAVDSFDSAQDKMRKSIIDAEKSGVKIPKELKKYAGL
jgi:hypothetical protein|tara:strand:- start:155 stop:394 length:240 start_codon:yes stop_codon:yes gene_type:complete